MMVDESLVLRIPIPSTDQEWRVLHDKLWTVGVTGFYTSKDHVLISFESEADAIQFKLTHL